MRFAQENIVGYLFGIDIYSNDLWELRFVKDENSFLQTVVKFL